MVRATKPNRTAAAAPTQAPSKVERRNLDDLRTMMLIRRFEDAAAEQYANARIGGFLHLYNGQEAVAGGHMPLTTGLALAIQYQGSDAVVMCFFGDGAVNEGEWHEALNLSAVW